LTDVNPQEPRAKMAPLPAVDWSSIGRSAPQPVAVEYGGPDAPLPPADVALLTWTSAEWSALDHVWLDGAQAGVRWSKELESEWYRYSRDVGTAQSDNAVAPLWGYYQLVDVATSAGATVRVLLFKCDAHLAHPPWIEGLIQMVQQVLTDSKPSWIYSIGTAGGSREDLRLGDVPLTNVAHIQLEKPENGGVPISGQTFTCEAFPSTDLLEPAQSLMFDLSEVVTEAVLNDALTTLHGKYPDTQPFGYADLVNAPLDPANLGAPRALAMKGTPLLTTDYYYIAEGTDAEQYCFLEMDDAVIAYVAQQAGVNFAFARNISDPLVAVTGASGQPIPDDVRQDWSGQVYTEFGLYTSFNSAVATWAAIAG
jgi:nucleoside phosphorylase